MWHKHFSPQLLMAFLYKYQHHFSILMVSYTNTYIMRITHKIFAEHGEMLPRPLQVG